MLSFTRLAGCRSCRRENYPVHGGTVNSENVANYRINGINCFHTVFIPVIQAYG
jgi:hypothetical protein